MIHLVKDPRQSDGLASMIDADIKRSGISVDRFFVFDMSVPDSLSYLKGSIPVYSRISDYEIEPPFKDKAAGIWVDNFDGSYPQVRIAKELMKEGLSATIVSPELHGRDHRSVWNEILTSEIYLNPLFRICTDFAEEAALQFCKD